MYSRYLFSTKSWFLTRSESAFSTALHSGVRSQRRYGCAWPLGSLWVVSSLLTLLAIGTMFAQDIQAVAGTSRTCDHTTILRFTITGDDQMTLIQQPVRDRCITIDPPVPQEWPIPAHIFERFQIHFSEQNFFVVVRRPGDYPAKRIAN